MSAEEKQPLFDRWHDHFIEKYNTPGFSFDLNLVRCIVSLFFAWKLLSRDFGFYGTVPDGVFPFYSINIYPADSYIMWTGLPLISELATFHWIHFLLPYPSPAVLRVIQGIAIVLLVILALYGRGPRRSIAIGAYCLVLYLWGYMFLGGHEIDAILLYFGLLAIIAVSEFDDRPIHKLSSLARVSPTRSAGHAVSLMYLLFATYYFASGVNKLTDISFWEWFEFDLAEAMYEYRIKAENGYTSVPYIFEPLYEATWLNYLGPPAVYISHLITPMVFFWRNQVFKFFLFYAAFHFLTFGVGISFTGYVLVWFVLFPYHRLLFGKATEVKAA